ncbi:MAG TPA: FadR/GntR family transcriptional regulator [Acetobacteraceae bacterium]
MLVSSPFDDFVRRYGSTPRRGVFGLLVHDIGRRVVGGEFTCGATLPNEDELVLRFGVSRSTFREAMKTLASKGLVEIRPKTGTRVRDARHWHHTDPDVMVWYFETGPSQAVLDALRDVRRVLEPAAAARAALAATEEETGRIAAAFDAMGATIGDPVAHSEADREFHTAIFEATHNFILARLIDVIVIGIYGNAVSATAQVVRGQQMSLPYHRAVLDAIRARDANGAAAATDRLLDTWQPNRERIGKARSEKVPL